MKGNSLLSRFVHFSAELNRASVQPGIAVTYQFLRVFAQECIVVALVTIIVDARKGCQGVDNLGSAVHDNVMEGVLSGKWGQFPTQGLVKRLIQCKVRCTGRPNDDLVLIQFGD